MARVMVVGSGWRFTSGISYYTCRLANELSARHHTSALLMRRLVPAWAYPGRARVGVAVNELAYRDEVEVFDGVDWYWGPSMRRARAFLHEQRPEVVVLQWWTGAVLHSYLALAAEARRVGAEVVVEFHESHDSGEARIPLVSDYVRLGLPRLLARATAAVVHSDFDRRTLLRNFPALEELPLAVVPHGPYDHVGVAEHGDTAEQRGVGERRGLVAQRGRASVEDDVPADRPVRLLFFGTIRPYKGLEHLVAAFDLLSPEEAAGFELEIVGETWEGWTLPLELVATSPYRDRIHVTNRYVTDAEVRGAFARADVVVLPYLRSSASGPLHVAMSAGLPVIVTSVGGLSEAVSPYRGAVTVPPADPPRLARALRESRELVGRRFPDPHSWTTTCEAIEHLVRIRPELESIPVGGWGSGVVTP